MPAPATSIVSEKVCNADGTPFVGLITIQALAMESGTVVVRSGPIKIGSLGLGFTDLNYILIDGMVTVALAQNSTATPAGTSYSVTYQPATQSGLPTYTETWIVPAGGPYTIAQVLVASAPTPTVMIGVNQISGAGFSNGQVIEWNGSTFVPGSGGGGATIAHTTHLIAGDGAGNGADSGIVPADVIQAPLAQTFTSAGTPGNFTLANSAILVMNGSTEQLRIWATDPDVNNYNTANLYIGLNAGENQPSDNASAGYFNVGVGVKTLFNISTGYANTAVGSFTLQNVDTGSNNMGIGANALVLLTSGDENVGIGDDTLSYATTGSRNTAVGSGSGLYATDDNDLTFIGSAAQKSGVSSLSNSTAIGAGAIVDASNKVVIGNDAVVTTLLKGDLANPKQSTSAAAPGAGIGAFRWEAGTTPGTLKLVAYSGTSTTPTVIVDNVGSGN